MAKIRYPLCRKVSFEKNACKAVTTEDSWIFGASCIHLAAKFWPESLEILLPVFKRSLKRSNQMSTEPELKDLIDQKNEVENDKRINSVSPLHIAVTKCDSLSTR